MSNKFLYKIKKAFSLMELTICILIVSVLMLVSVPLIQDQMKKTDEYAYFLAFKTVERLGSQIVAFGDPEEGVSIAYNKTDFPDSEGFFEKLTNKIIPKAYALRTVLISYPSYEYDMARVCNDNSNVIQEYGTNAGLLFTKQRLGITDCNTMYTTTARLNKRFACNNSAAVLGTESINNVLKGVSNISGLTTNPSSETFCNEIALPSCRATVPPAYQSKVHAEYKLITLNQSGGGDHGSGKEQYGQCIIYVDDMDVVPGSTGTEGTQSTTGAIGGVTAITCNDAGYTNMSGSLSEITCNCDGSNPSHAINNQTVCCPTPAEGNVAYADLSGSCIENGCPLGAYDEINQTCCPDHAFYSHTLGHCVCAQGYTPTIEDGVVANCTLIEGADKCPAGYHYDEDSDNCVVNAPITKASRFCQLIVDNYNVSSSSCNTFDEEVEIAGADNISYYGDLFDAITANNTQYLSSKAVDGAFLNLTPNIVFANGLKLWILGDKVASIAGLSFNPTNYSPEINACADRDIHTQAECNALEDDSKYFCKGTNNCFTIDKGDGAIKLGDARNCCQVADFKDLQHQFAGNSYLRDARVYAINGFTVFVDITGDKDSDQGGGTLWKDVFPFYVSANGEVYPGYPLTGSEGGAVSASGALSLPTKYQGGNSSSLATDVYYYDIVNGRRTKRMAYSAVSYARAKCLALQVSAYSPYCQNLGNKFRKYGEHAADERFDQYIYHTDNPCWHHRCYVHLKNKIKFL